MHTQFALIPVARRRNLRRALLASAAAAFSLGFAAWQSQTAYADTIPVNTTDDEVADNGQCSLREAVQAANTDSAIGGCATGGGADTIVVPAGTYTLTIEGVDEDGNLTGDLDITGTLVISGAGAGETIIDANGIDRAISSQSGSYTATLRGLTIQHGAAGYGGAALFGSAAELDNVWVFSSTAQQAGGGVYVASDASLTSAVFEGNTSGEIGGGAYVHGTATVTGSRFLRNNAINGGGLLVYQTARIWHTEFNSNTAFSGGGAEFRGEATVFDSEFTGNVATGEAGGATFGLTSTVSSSRFEGNTAVHFGGAWFYGAATLEHTQFLSNTASNAYGGAAFFGDSSIHHSAFEANISVDGEVGGAWFNGNATLESTSFLRNTARVFTGGAVFYGDTNVIVDGRFAENVAYESSGGICTPARITHCISEPGQRRIGNDYIDIGSTGGAVFRGTTSITRTSFLSNTAPNVGGASFVDPTLVADSIFQSNSSTDPVCSTLCAGGAYFFRAGAVNGSVFVNNTTVHGAGGARFDAAASLSGAAFVSNTAQYGAGGAYFLVDGASVVDSQFAGNVATGPAADPCAPGIKAGCAAAQDQRVANGANSPGETVGGALFASGNSAVTRTAFSDNAAPGVGGARFAGSVILLDSSFSNNRSTGSAEARHSGGAYFDGAAMVAGTAFERNSSLLAGGGAYFANAATLTNTTFTGNSTLNSSGGGAFFVNAAQLTETEFALNRARHSGGGAHFSGAAVTVSGSLFVANSVAGAGGGAFFGYTTTIRSTQFTSNTAYSDGGALFVMHADLNGADFISNTSTGFGVQEFGLGSGGAGFGSTAEVVSTKFVANSTAGSGGGASFASSAAITSSLFIDNSARLDGGGAVFNGVHLQWWLWDIPRAHARIVNTLFGGNAAGNNGAAIYVHDTAGLQLLHVTIGSPRLEPNQAIAVHAGTVSITNTIVASHAIGIERSAGSVSEDYTLFSGVTTARRGLFAAGAHSRTGYAAFADPASGNYRLTARSDALNNGIDAGLDHDIDGQQRMQGHGRGSDIGFDEFAQWIQILTMVWKS